MKHRIVRRMLAVCMLVGSAFVMTPAVHAAPDLPPCVGPTSCTLPLP
jgi:hypothetical protein